MRQHIATVAFALTIALAIVATVYAQGTVFLPIVSRSGTGIPATPTATATSWWWWPTATSTATPTATATPQLGPITILSAHCRSILDTWQDCTGEVRNDTSIPVYYVEVSVTFRNAAGQLAGSAGGSAVLRMLQPGERSLFEIYLVSVAPDWASYQFAIQDYSTSSWTQYMHLPVVNPNAYWDAGTYYVQGEVQNNTASMWCYVKAVVTLYDAGGSVIDSYYSYVAGRDMEPERQLPFRTWFSNYDGHLAGLTSYAIVAEGQECY